LLLNFRNFIQRLQQRPADRLPVSTYVGYGAGQIGGQILRDTPALILPIYMTTVLGIEAALAGLVIIIAKVWVVIADPIAGVMSDKTETRWGAAGLTSWVAGFSRQRVSCCCSLCRQWKISSVCLFT